MIVAHEGQRAAVARRAGEIDVAEGVAAAVDAWTFAVPEREDAVIFAFAAHLGLLRAPDGGRGEILVEPGHVQDIIGVEERLGLVHLRVDAAERRAAVAGDETRSVQSSAAVRLLLHKEHAHDRLGAGDQNARPVEIKSIGERRLGEGGAGLCVAGGDVRHYCSPARNRGEARLGLLRSHAKSKDQPANESGSKTQPGGLPPQRRPTSADSISATLCHTEAPFQGRIC